MHAQARDEAWMADAACRGKDTAEFFPESWTPPHIREICEACPVREECLDYALRYHEHGIWGGTTAKDRRRIRMERTRDERRRRLGIEI